MTSLIMKKSKLNVNYSSLNNISFDFLSNIKIPNTK